MRTNQSRRNLILFLSQLISSSTGKNIYASFAFHQRSRSHSGISRTSSDKEIREWTFRRGKSQLLYREPDCDSFMKNQPQRSDCTTSRRVTSHTEFDCQNESNHFPIEDLKKQKIKSRNIEEKFDLKFLLIDNYDSYTYNLYHYFAEVCIEPPRIITNDDYEGYSEIMKTHNQESLYERSRIDGIIISPGPGNPMNPSDIGICMDAIKDNPDLPIFGVCLGHQTLGFVYNATVKHSPTPMHGRISQIKKTKDNEDSFCLFENLPEIFNATRYHSLMVDYSSISKDDSDSVLEPFAFDINDGVNMALRHKSFPHYGVQFHPESIGTDFGKQIIYNFCRLSKSIQTSHVSSSNPNIDRSSTSSLVPTRKTGDNDEKCRVLIHKLQHEYSPTLPLDRENYDEHSQKIAQLLFESIYATKPCCFWLDSSSSSKNCPQNSRFSIMGCKDDEPSSENEKSLSKLIEYYGKEDHTSDKCGIYVDGRKVQNVQHNNKDGEDNGGFLQYLDNALKKKMTQKEELVELHDDSYVNGQNFSYHSIGKHEEELPFNYRGGYVGYFGYELRHDTMPISVRDKQNKSPLMSKNANPNVPTAAFLFADKSIVFDHHERDIYLIGVADLNDVKGRDSQVEGIINWMKRLSKEIPAILGRGTVTEDLQIMSKKEHSSSSRITFTPNRSKSTYQKDIERCHEEIRNGESYELCLINHLEAKVIPKESSKTKIDPFSLYKILRKRNPAPYAAYMKFDSNGRLSPTSILPDKETKGASVALCCSSPERFLSIFKDKKNSLSQDKNIESEEEVSFCVESKPIKGTIRRYSFSIDGANVEKDSELASSLQFSEKNRAENLMIVDLIRNDFSRVCQIGSVDVPKLMQVESYATVHQLVSTIRGTLSKGTSCLDVIKATFPGGSMTGAPKKRTVDILDESLERGVVRGPYAGSLGYLSLNGCMDMNIIIRTAMLTPSEEDHDGVNISIGAGGAITQLSECEDEYDEMMLKARPLINAVDEWSIDMKLEDGNFNAKKRK